MNSRSEEILRKNAMKRYLEGESPKDIYTDMGRSKYWFFTWRKRFLGGDPNWFRERSRKPRHLPTKLDRKTRELIVAIRKELMEQPSEGIGVPAIRKRLAALGVTPPSDRTISRILKEYNLVR